MMAVEGYLKVIRVRPVIARLHTCPHSGIGSVGSFQGIANRLVVNATGG